MKTLLLTLMLLTFASLASAATLVLDPLNGYHAYPDYLGASCGGVHLNAGAKGFDSAGAPVTLIEARTSCSTGGRGSRVRRYLACWDVTYAVDGSIVSRELTFSGSRLSPGGLPIACPIAIDPDAIFVNEDADGIVIATLYTVLTPSGYRAALDVADVLPIDLIAPSTPTAFIAVAVSDTQVDLTWQPSSDTFPGLVVGYVVTRDGVDVIMVAGTAFSDTVLAPSTTYFYTVRAMDSSGNVSIDSELASVTTADAVPPPPPCIEDCDPEPIDD
jgi:hypothetical protein